MLDDTVCSSRKIRQLIASTSLQDMESLMELDTHADTTTTVLGKNCLIIQEFNQTVAMSFWDTSKGNIDCPTVRGVIAYDF